MRLNDGGLAAAPRTLPECALIYYPSCSSRISETGGWCGTASNGCPSHQDKTCSPLRPPEWDLDPDSAGRPKEADGQPACDSEHKARTRILLACRGLPIPPSACGKGIHLQEIGSEGGTARYFCARNAMVEISRSTTKQNDGSSIHSRGRLKFKN